MDRAFYIELKKRLINEGWKNEFDYIKELIDNPCTNPQEFRDETIYVIINSGMKWQIAKVIYEKVLNELNQSGVCEKSFGHKGKVKAINNVWQNYKQLWTEFQNSEDKVSYLETIPFIGKITKYHLARNMGVNTVKPDRHLVRIAKEWKTDCFKLCKKLSDETGDLVGVVDVIIWRGANLGYI